MFEKKISQVTKAVIKGLTLQNGKTVDEDGVVRDLNKVVAATFEDGDVFDFQVTSKNDQSEICDEGSDSDE